MITRGSTTNKANKQSTTVQSDINEANNNTRTNHNNEYNNNKHDNANNDNNTNIIMIMIITTKRQGPAGRKTGFRV